MHRMLIAVLSILDEDVKEDMSWQDVKKELHGKDIARRILVFDPRRTQLSICDAKKIQELYLSEFRREEVEVSPSKNKRATHLQ